MIVLLLMLWVLLSLMLPVWLFGHANPYRSPEEWDSPFPARWLGVLLWIAMPILAWAAR